MLFACSEQVRECGVGLAGVNVFPTTESGDLCVTDIAVKTGEDERTDQLCLASMYEIKLYVFIWIITFKQAYKEYLFIVQ